MNVLPNIYGHIFEISLTYSMEFVKIYSWVRSRLCKLQKGCTRLAADIAEILLKVTIKHKKIKSKADYINNHLQSLERTHSYWG
jgi:hypothetical protein